jgi:glutathione S-transferase
VSALNQKEAVLYADPVCPACETVKAKLEQAGWPFRVVEVHLNEPNDEGSRALRAALSGWSGYVPVLDVDGVLWELGVANLWDSFAPWPLPKPEETKA